MLDLFTNPLSIHGPTMLGCNNKEYIGYQKKYLLLMTFQTGIES